MHRDDPSEDDLDPDSAPPPLALIPSLPPIGEPTDVLDMDATGIFTQKIRVRVIQQINKNLHQIEDPAMFSALLKAAADMDKFTSGRRRVGIEEAAAQTAEASARDTAGILRAITSNMMRVDPALQGTPRETLQLPNNLTAPELVPGETEQGVHELSYDAFAKGRRPD